ncbi:MAG: RsmB/NOP family class I SAM-dependent RNA methyltransferase, partial [Deltaproteobacteria bacterium]|nr:RsmB/NOP family class I SAM-dependent RNA methyltransferase [Deltaproteobacteria bacterium]
GPDSAESLLDAGNRIPNMVIRVNTLKTDCQGLLERLNEEGVTGSTSLYSPEGVTLEGLKGPVNRLAAFKEGLFQVQGEAAQIGSHLLCPRPGDSVLDVCAGLGGKSTHLAAIMEDKGFILALDRTRSRLISLLQSSIRLGTGSVKPVVADASGPLSTILKYPFDNILVDGPCSGLGVISKNPDIKLTKRAGDIKRLARLQTTILNQAVHLLRKGGRMLYLTCTISKEENEGVVKGFLETNSEIALENLKITIPEWGLDLIDDNGFFRPLPHIHGMEGFFGALFTKT